MSRLKRRIERLETKAETCGESADESDRTFVSVMARILEDLPAEDFCMPECVTARPSEAGGLKPYNRNHAVGSGAGGEDDSPRSYFGRFSLEDLEVMKVACRALAVDIRAGMVSDVDDLFDRLPQPVLHAMVHIFRAMSDEEGDSESEIETAQEYELRLRRYATEVSNRWKTSAGPIGNEGVHWFDYEQRLASCLERRG